MSYFKHKQVQPLFLQEVSRNYENQAEKSKLPKESAKNLALDFGKTSTIHGVNRIFKEHSNVYERLFWFLTLVLALGGCIYVCIVLSRRYNAGSLQTVIETTKKPVFEIPFPEVAICNENRLNWDRIEEAKERFIPGEKNTERIRLFELVIGLHDNLEFGVFGDFEQLQGEPVHLVNNINFSLVFDFMTWHCEELLKDCVWHHESVNCCEIFEKTVSLSGICWHFNTLSTEESRTKQLMDNKYPWKTGSAGPKSGLVLKVLINEDKHYRKYNDKGVLVIISEPQVYYMEPQWIPANTEAAIEVHPVIYFADNGTRSVSPMKRLCLFSDERSDNTVKHLKNFPYMFENCETQCRQQYLLKYCNCTMDLLFPHDNYPYCRAQDLICLAKYNEYFRFTYKPGEEEFVKRKVEGMICNCFRNCHSLNYITDVRPSFLPHYLRDNTTYVVLDVHYPLESMMVYRTSLVFSWIDLMVAFGGIAGLFLGCSLISGIELLYFTLVELPCYTYHKLKAKQHKPAKLYNNELDVGRVTRKLSSWSTNNRIMDVSSLAEDGFVSQEL